MNTLGTLLRLRFRRDRVQLLVWILLFVFLAVVVTAAVTGSYGTEADRAQVIQIVLITPAVLMLRGTPQGAAADAFQFFLIFGFLGVMIGLASTFLAVRHSRAEEESGRAELIGATPASRLAPLVATALEGTLFCIAIGIVSAIGYLASGADPAGSWLAGAALAAVGIAFVGVGLLSSQLMRTSRGANGLAAAIVTLAYVLRGLGDATGTVHADGLSMTTGWLSWLSPIGWGAATAPFSHPSPLPLVLCLVLGGALFAASLALQSSRDIDSSIVPERAGRLSARPSLSGPFALAWRMLRNPVIGWMIAAGLFGLLVGGLGETMVELTKTGSDGSGSAPAAILNELNSLAGPGAHGTIIDLFTVAMFGLVGALAAVAAVQSMVRARHDEASGTAEVLLSTPLTRVRWFLSHLTLGVVTAVAVLGTAVLGAVIGLTRTSDFGDRAAVVAKAGLVQLPAVLVLLAVVGLIFAVLPRLTIGLGWAVLLAAIFIGQFGGLFGFSDAVRGISPFTHTPLVTSADADWSGLWWMLALALLLGGAAAYLVRKRDLALGS